MIDEPVGAALDRNLTSSQAPGEHVEVELDVFISRRDKEHRRTEGERTEEALWKESVRRHDAVRSERNRLAWHEYHTEQAERHRAVERYQNRCHHEPQLRGG